jgi:hypothetical protein
VLTVNGHQHLAAPVRDAPSGERLIEAVIHQRRQRVGLSVKDDDRAIFQYQRVDVVGDLWEFSMQFGSDAARDEYD